MNRTVKELLIGGGIVVFTLLCYLHQHHHPVSSTIRKDMTAISKWSEGVEARFKQANSNLAYLKAIIEPTDPNKVPEEGVK